MLLDTQRITELGSWRYDLSTGELEWSPKAFAIFGRDSDAGPPELSTFYAQIHEADRTRVIAAHRNAVARCEGYSIAYRIQRPDGVTRYVRQEGACRHDEGHGCAIVGTVEDITDDPQAGEAVRAASEQQRLSERLRQFGALVEGTDDLCGIADADYRVLWVNQAYAQAHDAERAALEGRSLAAILGTEHFQAWIKAPFDRCLAGEPQCFEIEREHPRDGHRRLLIRHVPIELPGTSDRYVGAVITDVTAMRAAEAEAARQADLLAMAGRVARFGGWSVDLVSGAIEWSNAVAAIHGMPSGYAPASVEEAIAFYAPEYRERARSLLNACMTNGDPFDKELAIIADSGQRVWVRAVGEAFYGESGAIVGVQGAFQDITRRREQERQRHKLAQITEQSPAAIAVTDASGVIEYANAAYERLSGYARDELVGNTPAIVQSGNTPDTVYRDLWQTITRGDVWTGELQNRRKDGGLYWESAVISPLTDEQGRMTNYVEIKQDITALKESQEQLRASYDELACLLESRKALIDALPANVALLDAEGTVIDVNETWRDYGRRGDSPDPNFGIGRNYLAVCDDVTGSFADEAAAVAAGLRAVLAGERQQFVMEYPCDGPTPEQWFQLLVNRLADAAGRPSDARAVLMHLDITERKRAESSLARLAYEDLLTGAASRQGLVTTLDQQLAQSPWLPCARLVMLDIRHQHDINEAYGFEAGDELLRQVAQRLSAAVDEEAVVGRSGGDEFVVYLPTASDAAADAACEGIAASFRERFNVAGYALARHARFGYTRLGETARDAERLLREAEMALSYADRDRDVESWSMYTAALDEASHQRIWLTDELRRALAQDEFELHFHPKVDLSNGALVGAEALLRWPHPEQGPQSPADFIPVAEQSELIGPIGDWVLDAACRQLRGWINEGLAIVRVAVNVSVVQFADGQFPDTVARALERYGLAPSALTLEITESVFEADSAALLRQLQALHDLGVRLALDDFGTGYSSLLYLQQYPFDEIKIDKGFVFNLETQAYDARVAASVIAIAEALGAQTVAEGVESPAIADTLLAMGCATGQGFYYAVPLAAEDFRWLLAQGSPLPLSAGTAKHEGEDIV